MKLNDGMVEYRRIDEQEALARWIEGLPVLFREKGAPLSPKFEFRLVDAAQAGYLRAEDSFRRQSAGDVEHWRITRKAVYFDGKKTVWQKAA